MKRFPLPSAHRGKIRGFTLMEMLVTMAIFILLGAAVFGIISGVLRAVSTLQDNQNHRDSLTSVDAFLKGKLGGLSAQGALVSYQRGAGEGLAQNGIVLGEKNFARAIDARVQANGYYVLRTTSLGLEANSPLKATGTDTAVTVLARLVSSDDPSLSWIPLIRDVAHIDWKFQNDLTAPPQWVDQWPTPSKPILVECTLQLAGDLRPSTMDFWLPRIANPPVQSTTQPNPP